MTERIMEDFPLHLALELIFGSCARAQYAEKGQPLNMKMQEMMCIRKSGEGPGTIVNG